MLLAGATGLVGGLLLQRLEQRADVSAIIVVARKTVSATTTKVQQCIGPIDDWPGLVADSKPDIAISALGTTLRQAGSHDAFAAVDHDAALAFARTACGAGARRFILVSSVGAHPSSRNFYLATKGRAEASIQAVGFDRLDIVRPGLLRGDRQGDARIGERLGILLSPLTDLLMPRVLDHFRSISANDVADAIMRLLPVPDCGTFIHENRDMWTLSERSA